MTLGIGPVNPVIHGWYIRQIRGGAREKESQPGSAPVAARQSLDGQIVRQPWGCTPAPSSRRAREPARPLARGPLRYPVFVQASDLPHSDSEGFHVVVVIGVSEQTIYVNDPALDSGPKSVPLDYFMLAWSEFEYACAVITS
jgi:hypothetical protein